MKDELISLKTAKLTDEKYFKAEVRWCYSKYGLDDYDLKLYHPNVYQGPDPIYLAPTQSLLQRWLREKHGIEINVLSDLIGYALTIIKRYPLKRQKIDGNNIFQTYEQALEGGLFEALKLIKDD